MNLNKRDLYKYKKFIKQIEKGSGDSYFDQCIPFLVRCIEKFYCSDETKMFDIEDFIQECLIKANEYREKNLRSFKNTLERSFSGVYQKMKDSTDYDFSDPVNLGDLYDEIDDSIMDYDTFFASFRKGLPSDKQQIVLDSIRKGQDIHDIAHELHMRKSNAYSMRDAVLGKIRKSEQFRELTDDKLSLFYSNYQAFAIKISRQELLEPVLVRFWKGRMNQKDYSFYCEEMIHLLKFFYHLEEECCVEPYQIYISCIQQDIQNILSVLKDNPRMSDRQRVELKKLTSTSYKTK